MLKPHIAGRSRPRPVQGPPALRWLIPKPDGLWRVFAPIAALLVLAGSFGVLGWVSPVPHRARLLLASDVSGV
ncbi:MAG: hypothetical protein KGL70_09905, partial [Betaproteobacteria bacterium]|nr:hypothetical protein [Betaproteobacteria bacterium]